MRAVEVRAFEDGDRAGVVALWNLVFPDDPPHNAPEGVIDRKCAVQRELFLVAVAGGEIVGTVLGGYDGFRGWLYHMAVHPQRRRRGVGRRLIEVLEALLRERGCPKLNLQVRAGNDGARAFYEALGFAFEDRVSLARKLG